MPRHHTLTDRSKNFAPLLGVLLSVALSPACISPFNSCIAKGMRVETPRGRRRIEDLRAGDEVYCYNPETGERVVSHVTAIRSAMRECSRLHLEGGRSLMLTGDHPIYDPEAGDYFHTSDWITGTRTHVTMLRAGGEGLFTHPVVQVEMFAALSEVFDISVEHELHNFIVEGLLVHNKSIAILCEDYPPSQVTQLQDMALRSELILEPTGYTVVGSCDDKIVVSLQEDRAVITATQEGLTGLIVEGPDGVSGVVDFAVEREDTVVFSEEGSDTPVTELQAMLETPYVFDYTAFDASGDALYVKGFFAEDRLWTIDAQPQDSDAFTTRVDRDAETITITLNRALTAPVTFKSPNGEASLTLEP